MKKGTLLGLAGLLGLWAFWSRKTEAILPEIPPGPPEVPELPPVPPSEEPILPPEEPVLPVAEIQDINWGGFIWITYTWPGGGETRRGCFFAVRWNCGELYNGFWIIRLTAQKNAILVGGRTVLPDGPGTPTPLIDYPIVPLQPGTYETDVWFEDIPPLGDYRVVATIDRGHGGYIVPTVLERGIDEVEKVVSVPEYELTYEQRLLLTQLGSLIFTANTAKAAWMAIYDYCRTSYATMATPQCQQALGASQSALLAVYSKKEECEEAGIPVYLIDKIMATAQFE